MKYILKAVFLFFSLGSGIVNAQELIPFSVAGRIGNYSMPYKAYLTFVSPDGLRTDSVAMTDGSFSFSGVIKSPRKAYLSISNLGEGQNLSRDGYRTFFLEPGIVKLESPDSLSKLTVTGGKINLEYSALEAMLRPANDSIVLIYADFIKIPAEQRKTPEFENRYRGRIMRFQEQLFNLEMDFMHDHPDSWVSLMTMLDDYYGGRDLAPDKPVFNAFSPPLKASPAGLYLTPLLMVADKTAIGATAMDFTIPDTAGRRRSLKEFRGKYVLVDFWASWCGPCRAENPNVLKVYNAFKAKRFTVVSISIDDAKDRKKWIAAIKKDGMPWTQLSELKGWESPVAKNYGIVGIPQNFLLDPEGRIVAKGLRGDELKAKLTELIKN